MRITKRQLRQIIKEEVLKLNRPKSRSPRINEMARPRDSYHKSTDVNQEAVAELRQFLNDISGDEGGGEYGDIKSGFDLMANEDYYDAAVDYMEDQLGFTQDEHIAAAQFLQNESGWSAQW